MDQPKSNSAHAGLMQAGAAGALARCGFPAISRGQAEAIRIGPPDAAHRISRSARRIRGDGRQARRRRDQRRRRRDGPQDRADRRGQRQSADGVDQGAAADRARQGRRDHRRDQLGVGARDRAGRAAQPTLFFNTGCNSDELRGKSCNRYMFHTEAANTMYVYAAGQALLRDGMVKGKKWYSLTADYAFGHDLLKAAKRFMQANGGEFAADELVPTDAADFSAYLLKIRNAKPDLVVSNLAGAQITNFMKQYMEYGLPYPVAGFGVRHRGRVGRGQGQRHRHLAAGVGLAGQDAVGAEIHRGVHEEIRQAAGEPGVGRLHVDQARRAGDERDQVAPTRRRSPSTWRRARSSTC